MSHSSLRTVVAEADMLARGRSFVNVRVTVRPPFVDLLLEF